MFKEPGNGVCSIICGAGGQKQAGDAKGRKEHVKVGPAFVGCNGKFESPGVECLNLIRPGLIHDSNSRVN